MDAIPDTTTQKTVTDGALAPTIHVITMISCWIVMRSCTVHSPLASITIWMCIKRNTKCGFRVWWAINIIVRVRLIKFECRHRHDQHNEETCFPVSIQYCLSRARIFCGFPFLLRSFRLHTGSSHRSERSTHTPTHSNKERTQLSRVDETIFPHAELGLVMGEVTMMCGTITIATNQTNCQLRSPWLLKTHINKQQSGHGYIEIRWARAISNELRHLLTIIRLPGLESLCYNCIIYVIGSKENNNIFALIGPYE